MKIGIYPNLGKEMFFSFYPQLISWLEEQHIEYYFPVFRRKELEHRGFMLPEAQYKTAKWMGSHADLILSVGGDGSFLEAAREFADYNTMLCGIHLGELGFLNSITPADFEKRMELLLNGSYSLESRRYVSASIKKKNGTSLKLPTALNDIVIGRNKMGKMARINMAVNHHHVLRYAVDGIVISTATGSTSYSLSCGGPILSPTSKSMIAVPVCAHMIQGFPMVLSDMDTVQVTLPEREDRLLVSADGKGSYELLKDDTLTVEGVDKPLRFIRFEDHDFWATIHSKLHCKL